MANQVSAILKGEDYQHIYSWQYILELLIPKKNVCCVKIEDPDAGSVDDVTVHYTTESLIAPKFYQVKYHVDHRSCYSAEILIEEKPESSSLLRKFWQSWQLLYKHFPQRGCELYLVGKRSDIGKILTRWQTHLGASDEDFANFISSLRFRYGYGCWEEVKERVIERMGNLNLKSDNNALLIVIGIVREWIKSGQSEITCEVLKKALKDKDLYLELEKEQCVTVYLTTIKEQQFEIEPDYHLDWRDYFTGNANKKSHQTINPTDWNNCLLPKLEELEKEINKTKSRLVRARGFARLSAWIAFGYHFSEVARYIIEVEQQKKYWRTDAAINDRFAITVSSKDNCPNGEVIEGKGNVVAVGISVTESLDNDVRRHLEKYNEKVAALLLLRPEKELGRDCLVEAGDVVALADKTKGMIRNFVKHWQATRLLLYYFGPLSGACFLGHRLNAVCKEIQIMEEQQPGYAPSFLLR